MTIHKYVVRIDDLTPVLMPTGADVLCVQMQKGAPCVWARVDPAAAIVTRVFRWRGTGHSADAVGRYVGTIQLHDGSLVFHLFVDSEAA